MRVLPPRCPTLDSFLDITQSELIFATMFFKRERRLKSKTTHHVNRYQKQYSIPWKYLFSKKYRLFNVAIDHLLIIKCNYVYFVMWDDSSLTGLRVNQPKPVKKGTF